MEGREHKEIVTCEDAILSQLTEIASSHRPVKISTSDTESQLRHSVDSTIELVEPQNNSLLLHKPGKNFCELLTDGNDELELSCYTPGGVISFQSNYLPSSRPRLESALRVQVPEQLIREQRRAHNRVKIGHLDNVASLHIKKDLKLEGECLDISEAGALICLPRDKRGVDLGEMIDRCDIEIRNLISINQPVRICSMGVKQGILLIGVQFMRMTEQGILSLRNTLGQVESQFSNA